MQISCRVYKIINRYIYNNFTFTIVKNRVYNPYFLSKNKMTKKIFYWSPYLGRIATIKAVINSASVLKKIKKNYIVSIIDCYQEWDKYRKILNENSIDIIGLQKNIKFNVSITGFFKSRLIYILSFFLLYRKLKRLLNSEKPDFLMVHLLIYMVV